MKPLNLLGVSASPRRRGNSFFLLERAIRSAKEIGRDNLVADVFSFHGKRIGPCIQCYQCDKTHGDCLIKDDFHELRDRWLAADIVLYSVPVWHLSIPSHLKCFFERLGQSMSKRYPRKRRGEQALHLKVVGNIAQGLDIFSGQEHALMDLLHHAVLQNCITISGETYIGGGGWTRGSRETNAIEILAREGDALASLSILAAESIGKRAVQLALILRAGFLEMASMLEGDNSFRPVLERLAVKR